MATRRNTKTRAKEWGADLLEVTLEDSQPGVRTAGGAGATRLEVGRFLPTRQLGLPTVDCLMELRASVRLLLALPVFDFLRQLLLELVFQRGSLSVVANSELDARGRIDQRLAH